jgi:hypothetical protein
MDHHEFAVLTVGGEPVGWASGVGGGIGLGLRCLPEEADEAVVGGIRGEVVGGELLPFIDKKGVV